MNLIFTWKEILIRNGTRVIERYPATCRVRNELNDKRMPHQVIYTIPVTGKPTPYYPRTFPSGIYEITSIEWLTDPAEIKKFGPVKIKTNATREVYTWDLDTAGNYWKPTGKTQIDMAYWIHHTHKYLTTQGCIRGGSTEAQMISIAQMIEPNLEYGDSVKIEVL